MKGKTRSTKATRALYRTVGHEVPTGLVPAPAPAAGLAPETPSAPVDLEQADAKLAALLGKPKS